MPGGPRTGAPGKHVVKGKSKYRLIDEQVRYFVAPPIETIQNSPVRPRIDTQKTDTHENVLFVQLKPYVSTSVYLSREQKTEIYGKLPKGGLNGEHYLKIASKLSANEPVLTIAEPPSS